MRRSAAAAGCAWGGAWAVHNKGGGGAMAWEDVAALKEPWVARGRRRPCSMWREGGVGATHNGARNAACNATWYSICRRLRPPGASSTKQWLDHATTTCTAVRLYGCEPGAGLEWTTPHPCRQRPVATAGRSRAVGQVRPLPGCAWPLGCLHCTGGGGWLVCRGLMRGRSGGAGRCAFRTPCVDLEASQGVLRRGITEMHFISFDAIAECCT